MKKIVWGTLAASCLLASGAAQAENNIYLGAQALQYEVDLPHVNIGNGAKPHGAQFVFGGDVSRYAALEARLGRSTKYDELPQDESVSVKVDTAFGLYAKGQYPVTEQIKPYVIAGFSKYEVDVADSSGRETFTDSDISLGVGVSVRPMKNLQVGVEFMRVSDENTNDIGAKVFSSSASVSYVFGS